MTTAVEDLIAAQSLIAQALVKIAECSEPEPPAEFDPADEMIIAAFDPVTVAGIGGEQSSPFVFDCAAQDLIVIAKCQRSGVTGEAGILSLENADKSRYLQVGIGYNFATGLAESGRVSLRTLASSGNFTDSGVGSQEAVSAPAEVMLHHDCDRQYLNLLVRDGIGWKWVGSCKAPKFTIERVRFFTRNGSSAPANQSVTFTDVWACHPYAVWPGDSVAAGHNAFDPDGAYYSGKDNGLSQGQAHCWPFPARRNSWIVNKGIGGQNTSEMNARISEAHKHGNRLVLLPVQNNDSGDGVTLEQRTANIQSSIDACVAAGCMVVLIGAIYANNNQAGAAYFKEWRDNYLPLLTGHAGYIEIMDVLADPATGNIAAAYTDDGLHPNVAGYALIGPHVAQFVAQLTN